MVRGPVAAPALPPTLEGMTVRRPTMRDVAAAAGVSLKTVSRVVNNEPKVDALTAGRVQAAIEALGFRRNEIARSLRPGQTTATLGLITEDIGNPFYSGLARGIEEAAREQGYLLISGSSEENAERERELVQTLLQRNVDGLLVVPALGDHGYLGQDRLRGTPAVFLDRPATGVAADVVLLDNRGGARRAVEHLLELGHRRIGLVDGDPTVYTGAERMVGYRDALTAAGLQVDESLLRLGRHDPAQAEEATLELLALSEPPTALFTTNNRMSLGALRAMRARGEWLALAGFDDFELADLLPLPIAVVRYDTAAMGRLGAELLFMRLAGDTRPPERRVVPVELVMRGSQSSRQ